MKLIPSSGRGALARFAIGAVIVIAFTATTTAVAGLLQFKQAAQDLGLTPAIKHAQVKVPTPGAPQTILILGSDHRAHQPLQSSHSDTIMLVRLNADSSTINVMSVPRDLRVQIPTSRGGIQTAKINQAYSMGGPNLVVKTLRQNVFPQLEVNHIVDINFGGFKALVDQIGCVYTDVDRRYYHVSSGLGANDYSSINLYPGYQKLCDEDALAYVRYRHTDTDIVRSARQQNFIRDAKDQYGQTNLIENRDTLLKIFGAHTQTDADLHTTDGLINLFNLIAFADGHAIRTVHFPAVLQPCTAQTVACYVTADPGAEARAYGAFMQVLQGKPASKAASSARPPAPPPVAHAPTAGLTPDLLDGKAQAAAVGNAGLPVYFPKTIPAGARYEGPMAGSYPRAYVIPSPQHQRYAAYRIVGAVNPVLGQYYGVQGTTWQKAPILANPSEIRYVGAKRLELHFDGQKLRLVAWRAPHGVYWISNTLSLDLTNQQMLGMAASLTSQ